MGLPVSFLAGLILLLLHAELDGSLPGEESVVALVLCLGLVAVPWLLARLVTRRLAGRMRSGHGPDWWLWPVLLALPAVVPACYGLLLFEGDLPRFAARWAPELQVVRLGMLCAPLLVMEVSMRLGEREAVRRLEALGMPPPALLGSDRLAMTFFVVTPFLAMAAAADLLALDRDLEVFFRETALGITLGLLLLVGSLCVALPLVFRWVMPVSSHLPTLAADDLRRTAGRLGFRGDALLSMRTGHRMVNAALVGPAPWPRYLVLTDGLLSLLDPLSLRGVVAHEVGHAKANHPGLLVLVFAGLPLLLFFPAVLLEPPEVATGWQVAALGAVGVGTWIGLRLLAHRFEYEADQLSAEALGGARYCVQALRRVGELSPRSIHRSSFRHPSESRRIRHLYACERDGEYCARFWRRGRWIRGVVLGAVALAVGGCVWAQVALWPVDRAAYSFYCGRLAEARERLAALPAGMGEPRRSYAEELTWDVDAALELGVRDGAWREVREELGRRAYARGEEVLVKGGDVGEAGRWLGLALYQRRPAGWLQALVLYCRAVGGEGEGAGEREVDVERVQRLRRLLLRLDTPEVVKEVLRGKG